MSDVFRAQPAGLTIRRQIYGVKMNTTKTAALKNITIVPATGGTYTDVAIAAGTTPRDIKKQIGLADEYVLTRGRGTEAIPDTENLYESVSDGTKLFATTDVQWGQ